MIASDDAGADVALSSLQQAAPGDTDAERSRAQSVGAAKKGSLDSGAATGGPRRSKSFGRRTLNIRRALSTKRPDKVQHELGHDFTKRSFAKPTYCHACGELCWGLTSVSYECELCGYSCHAKCLKKIASLCTMHAREAVEEPTPHQWILQKSRKKFFCNVCRHSVEGTKALCCRVCASWTHIGCRAQALDNCKPSATYSPDGRSMQSHFWIEGNLSSKAVCGVCNKPCASKQCLFGLRCGWCSMTAHPACLKDLTVQCINTELCDLILPADAVSMGMSVALSDVSCDAGAAGPEECCADATAPTHQLQVDVYEGESSRNTRRMRTVSIAENGTAAELLAAALDSFQVGAASAPDYFLELRSSERGKESARTRTASVDNGFLGWKCASCSFPNDCAHDECDKCGEADDAVRPAPDPRHQKADVLRDGQVVADVLAEAQTGGRQAALYIRSRLHAKELDNRKTILRIYPGAELKANAKFKTLAISEDTPLDEVVKIAGTKFGLPNIPDALVLQEVNLNDGVWRNVLGPNSSVWASKMTYNKRYINDAKFRLYLRKRSIAGDKPSTLFVSNIPDMAPDLIREVLESLCKESGIPGATPTGIPVVIPASGAAIVTFEAPERAEMCARVLKLSTVHQKQLRVMFLPEIMGDRIPDGNRPLLVFVNSKSGGGQGKELWTKVCPMLNPHQVFDITEAGPLPGLLAFRHLSAFRLLVAGGDGTVGWVLNALEEIRPLMKCPNPPTGILPIGTGNDLSRVLQWGGGFEGQKIRPILASILGAKEVLLDRWRIQCKEDEPATDPRADLAMTNYFGIGIDAQIALDFHESREANPEKFKSRNINKGVYVMKGVDALVKRPCKDLMADLVLVADGVEQNLPSDLAGIVVLNIGSFGAGADPWGPDKGDYAPRSSSDGLLEVVGVFGAWHLSNISAHIRTGKRLGQFGSLEFRLSSDLPVQVDGEPWRQQPGTIAITKLPHQAVMLQKVKRKGKAAPRHDSVGRRSSTVSSVSASTTASAPAGPADGKCVPATVLDNTIVLGPDTEDLLK